MMDEIEQRALFKFLVRKLKDCRRELTVHRAFAEELRERGYQDVDHILKMFRAEPMLDETLDLHFAWLERLVTESERDLRGKELLELLLKWEPEGEPN